MDAHEGQAAWAQAAGTILALAVAIGAPLVAARLERNRYRMTALALGELLLKSVEEAAIRLLGIQHNYTPDELDETRRELGLPSLLQTAAVFSVDRLESQAAMTAFLRLRGAAESASAAVEVLRRNPLSVDAAAGGMAALQLGHQSCEAAFQRLKSELA